VSLFDFINGFFEMGGGVMCFLNVLRILKDKQVMGVSWGVQAFFASWGWWNLIYYPSLGQWVSFVGGILLVTTNTAWVVLAIYYTRRNG